MFTHMVSTEEYTQTLTGVPGGCGPIITSRQGTVSRTYVCYFRAPWTPLSLPFQELQQSSNPASSHSYGLRPAGGGGIVTSAHTATTSLDQLDYHRTGRGLPSNGSQCLLASLLQQVHTKAFIKAISRKASHFSSHCPSCRKSPHVQEV